MPKGMRFVPEFCHEAVPSAAARAALSRARGQVIYGPDVDEETVRRPLKEVAGKLEELDRTGLSPAFVANA